MGQYARRLVLAACAAGVLGNGQSQPAGPSGATVNVEMQNVMYHFTDRVAVHIFTLQGKLVPAKPDAIPVFDDNRSFILAIDSAQISISADAMANVLNDHVFAARDAPLKSITISTEGNVLKIKGKLHSQGDIPFETDGTLAVNQQGEIVVHAQKIRAAHLPAKGLMDLLGLKIADLINTKKIRGVRAEQDDLVLDPEQILPPPRIQGRITDVRLKGNEIIQTFGDRQKTGQIQSSGNYMAYRGAKLRFGKLTMNDTDMILLDLDAQDPFDFYLDHYQEQLVAGYTRITPAFGLRVYMRDYDKLRNQKATRQRPATH